MQYLKKFGFLKGLTEGLRIDEQTPEGRVLLAMVDLLEELTDALSDMNNSHGGMRQELQDVVRDVERLEDSVDNLDDFLKDFSEDFSHLIRSLPDDISDETFETKLDTEEDDGIFYEVKCPKCSEEITLNEDMLGEGSIHCPQCGGLMEFDLRFADADDES